MLAPQRHENRQGDTKLKMEVPSRSKLAAGAGAAVLVLGLVALNYQRSAVRSDTEVAPLRERSRSAALAAGTMPILVPLGSGLALALVTAVSLLVLRRDFTKRKRTERRAAAQYAVTRALGESDSLGEAAPQLLKSICESLDWQLGVLWSVDTETDVLRCVDTWHTPLAGGDCAAISRIRTFSRGVGLPGRAWASHEPTWSTGVAAETDFPLGLIAAKDGLRGAVAFPILLGPEVLGVFAFFSHRLRELDEAVLVMMTTIGSQIGQFIERKRAEEQTYRTQQHLADFLENATVGLNWVGPDGHILWANQAEMNLLGYTREEYVGHPIAEFYVDRDVPADIMERLARNETLRDYEARLRCKDGSVKHVLIDASVLWEREKFVHARSFTRDITERKRAEEEVYRSEHRLGVQYAVTRILAESETLAEAGPRILKAVCEGLGWGVGAFWRMDKSVDVLRCREVWQAPTVSADGFTAARRECTCAAGVGLPGRIWNEMRPVWVHDIAGDPAFVGAEAAEKAGLRGAFGFPILLDTEILGVLEFFSPEVREPDENSLQTLATLGSQIAQFIEHKQAEVQLHQAQKLESVGRLAAGIAHEINTPIQFIGDNTRFLSDGFAGFRSLIENYRTLLGAAAGGADMTALVRRVKQIEEDLDFTYLKDEIPRAISQTLDGVDRVATIVRAMKDFAHGGATQGKAPADLNNALLSTLTVARNEIKHVAEVETDLGDLPLVVCHLDELNQVFLNLLVNAAHSIADVVAGSEQMGRIRVST